MLNNSLYYIFHPYPQLLERSKNTTMLLGLLIPSYVEVETQTCWKLWRIVKLYRWQ